MLSRLYWLIHHRTAHSTYPFFNFILLASEWVACLIKKRLITCVFLVLAGTQEYCQSETFSASCESGQVMQITRARYGRLRLGRCVTQDFGYMGCDNDVMQEMDGLCSGRRSCEVRVDESSFPSATPCHKDLKSYLEVSYHCIAGKCG